MYDIITYEVTGGFMGLWCLMPLSINDIPVLLVEETGLSGENNRPIAGHLQTLSHNVASTTHTITTMTSLEETGG